MIDNCYECTFPILVALECLGTLLIFVPFKDCIIETLHIPERSMGAAKLCGRETNRALTPLPPRWWLSVRAHELSNNLFKAAVIYLTM